MAGKSKKTPAWVKAQADKAEARSASADRLSKTDPDVAEAVEAVVLAATAEMASVTRTIAKVGYGGRPPKYKAEFAKQAKKLCVLGATDYDLAEFFEVTTSTIWRWQTQHSEFCSSLRVGKGDPDERVVRSLYQRAVGYSYNAVKIQQYEGRPVLTEYVEHIPPDPGAAKLWLSNRRSEEWRDRQDVTHSTSPALQAAIMGAWRQFDKQGQQPA